MDQEKKQPAANSNEPKKETPTDFTIAANDNPRANRNIKEAPFEKKTNNENGPDATGTEITDGEGG